MDNIEPFIIHYDGSEIGRIGFSSNGKGGDDWCDANAEFRNRVTASVLLDAIEVPGLLIKDLFRAEAEFCREVWGSTPNVTRLGKMLLEKTGETYIEDYFLGREESFDTQCAVSLGDVSLATIETIIRNIEASGIKCQQGEFEMSDVVGLLKEYVQENS